MAGFIMIPRDILDDFFAHGKKPFSHLDAFLWMINEAAIAPKTIEVKGKAIAIQRGQFFHSTRFMANAWGWSQPTVHRFIESKVNQLCLKNESVDESGNESQQKVITICNYDNYSGRFKDDESVVESVDESKVNQSRYKNESNNKERIKNKEEKINISSDFEGFWQPYPKKVGKKAAEKKFTSIAQSPSFDLEAIMKGLERYLKCKQVLEGFICNPATWLNEERWNDDYGEISISEEKSLPQIKNERWC